LPFHSISEENEESIFLVGVTAELNESGWTATYVDLVYDHQMKSDKTYKERKEVSGKAAVCNHNASDEIASKWKEKPSSKTKRSKTCIIFQSETQGMHKRIALRIKEI
jgi:hypothetical protein